MKNRLTKSSPEIQCCPHQIHVLQLVGEPVGGIRKHIHSIIPELDTLKFKLSYCYSSIATDSQFQQEITSIGAHVEATIPLRIKKKPHLSDFVNLLILVRFVKRAKVDIVHGHGAKGGLYARLLAQICGIRAIYTPHGGIAHNMFSVWEELLYLSVERWAVRVTDYFIFESNYTAAAFQKKIHRPLSQWMVNYNGIAPIDMPAVATRSKELGYDLQPGEVLKVGVFGMLRSQKGQIFAVQAIEQLCEKGVTLELHLFGDGPDGDMLRKYVHQNKLTSQVLMHGDVRDSDAHMLAMDVVLIPSLFESFGYVAIEAMALNKPVIACRVGGLQEVVNDQNGITIAPGSAAEIENALLFCLENPNKLKELAEVGYRKWMANFTIETVINNLESIYKKVVSCN